MMFVNSSWSSTKGARACAVPGELRGLQMAHRRFGRLPWADVVAPAAQLARNGFRVDHALARAVRLVADRRNDRQFDAFFRLYNPDTVLENSTLVNAPLAATLERVARYGADEFYTGEIARKLVADIQKAGGIITERDMVSRFARIAFQFVANKVIVPKFARLCVVRRLAILLKCLLRRKRRFEMRRFTAPACQLPALRCSL